MSSKLTQLDFDTAAAWTTFLGSASPEKVQALFQVTADKVPHHQTFVRFDPALSPTANIAEQLFLGRRTVEGHRQRLLEKTGATNAAGLVVSALLDG